MAATACPLIPTGPTPSQRDSCPPALRCRSRLRRSTGNNASHTAALRGERGPEADPQPRSRHARADPRRAHTHEHAVRLPLASRPGRVSPAERTSGCAPATKSSTLSISLCSLEGKKKNREPEIGLTHHHKRT